MPKIITNSLEAEVHPDWPHDDKGQRDTGATPGDNKLVHRFYGAVEIEGEIYRVKTTFHENFMIGKNKLNKFEGAEIEKPDGLPGSSLTPTRHDADASTARSVAKLKNNNQSGKISGLELLRGVEKSHFPGVGLLEESRRTEAEVREIRDAFAETEIEMLDEVPSNSKAPTRESLNSTREDAKLINNNQSGQISRLELLRGVDKSHFPGVGLLEESRRAESEVREIRDAFAEMVKASGVSVEVVSDAEARREAGGRADSGDRVEGYTKDGKVYLNEEEINPETPMHEYTHLWDDMVREEKPELWSRGKELLKETPLWEEVRNDPSYSDIRDNEDAIASEVHSRLTGAEGARIMEDMISESRKGGSRQKNFFV